MITPLVTFAPTSPTGTFKVGDLVTVALFGDKISGARVTRHDAHNVWVTLAGLTVPVPYTIGQPLVVDRNKVIDWGE
jgi:hypothetical protein